MEAVIKAIDAFKDQLITRLLSFGIFLEEFAHSLSSDLESVLSPVEEKEEELPPQEEEIKKKAEELQKKTKEGLNHLSQVWALLFKDRIKGIIRSALPFLDPIVFHALGNGGILVRPDFDTIAIDAGGLVYISPYYLLIHADEAITADKTPKYIEKPMKTGEMYTFQPRDIIVLVGLKKRMPKGTADLEVKEDDLALVIIEPVS